MDKLTPLLDGDIFLYEVGYAAETGWSGETPPPFEYVSEMLDQRIEHVCREAGGTEPPVVYLTGKGNFRFDIAKTKPYKDRPPDKKPFHYKNIKVYLKAVYNAIEVEGMEADDMLCVHQTAHLEDKDTIICTRDKDLRQCPGWHMGWEIGKQPAFGPKLIDEHGYLELSKSKLKGAGNMFFYSQILTGDTVDSIPGLPRYGPKKAYAILQDAYDEEQLFYRVRSEYQKVYGGSWKEHLLEQARLVWMIRKLNDDGSPVHWEIPYE